jgi:hypothetical protein
MNDKFKKSQWFSTFLNLRHTNFEQMFCDTTQVCNKDPNSDKNGTLVRRGTPVEKH